MVVEVESNINYVSSLILHPNGRRSVAISKEDNEVAVQVLQRRQFFSVESGEYPSVIFQNTTS